MMSTYMQIIITELNLAGISDVMLDAFYRLLNMHMTHKCATGPLCENMMSTTKPEVRNVLQCHQSRTGPWL